MISLGPVLAAGVHQLGSPRTRYRRRSGRSGGAPWRRALDALAGGVVDGEPALGQAPMASPTRHLRPVGAGHQAESIDPGFRGDRQPPTAATSRANRPRRRRAGWPRGRTASSGAVFPSEGRPAITIRSAGCQPQVRWSIDASPQGTPVTVRLSALARSTAANISDINRASTNSPGWHRGPPPSGGTRPVEQLVELAAVVGVGHGLRRYGD